jgi:hypothetical protein
MVLMTDNSKIQNFEGVIMKRVIIVVLAAITTVMVFVGCKSNPQTPDYKDDPRSQVVGAEGIKRPEWVSKPPKAEDLYYVVGDGRAAATTTAKKGTARQDGLNKLAQWKSAVVGSSVKDYIDESGTTGNTQSLENFQQAIVTRAQANVSGFSQEDEWIDPDGVYHILYSYPKSDLRSDYSKTLSDFRRSDAAAFADFKANEAYRYLEARMDKMDNE